MDISDAVYLLHYLYSGGAEPPAPFPAVGHDPSYDPIELPCQDLGDFEHARNALEEAEIVLPPSEDPGFPGDMLSASAIEPVDGTGGFAGLSPELPVFPGPGGLAWGFRPSYRTRYAERGNEAKPFVLETEVGAGWFSGIPHIVDAGPGAQPARYWIRWSASCVRGYAEGDPVCPARFPSVNRTTLVRDAQANEFRLYDLAGRVYVFHGYGRSGEAVKGRLKRVEGVGGGVVDGVVQKPRVELVWDHHGKLAEARLVSPVESGGTLVTSQRWVYEYSGWLGSDARIVRVFLERPALPEHLRVPYEIALRHWYDSVPELGGTAGDLMQVDAKTDLSPTAVGQAPQTVTKTWYYRYYTAAWRDEEPGWPHQVRHLLDPDAAAELDAASYKTADVSGVADRTYEYCEDRRVRSLKLRGISCGGCGSQGSYAYGWALEKPQSAAAPNESHIRLHIQLPREESVDSVRRILIYNAYGQKLVDARCVRESPGSPELSWVDGADYGTAGDEAWCLRQRFWPSALEAFVPGDLLGCLTGPAPPFAGDGDIQGYAASSRTGRQREYVYAWTQETEPVFTLTRKDGIADEGISDQRGFRTMGAVSVKLLSDGGYRKRAVTWKLSEYDAQGTQVVVRETVFSYTPGSVGRHAEDVLALKRYTKTYPAVSTSKNGPGNSVFEYFGESRVGMPRWHRNPAARIEYREYDPVTWELARLVEDANLSSLPGTEPPSGFWTPSGAIHAETTFEWDALGRVG